jgi:hypothetical protein
VGHLEVLGWLVGTPRQESSTVKVTDVSTVHTGSQAGMVLSLRAITWCLCSAGLGDNEL